MPLFRVRVSFDGLSSNDVNRLRRLMVGLPGNEALKPSAAAVYLISDEERKTCTDFSAWLRSLIRRKIGIAAELSVERIDLETGLPLED